MARKRRFSDEERDHILRADTNWQHKIHPVWWRLWERNLAIMTLYSERGTKPAWRLHPKPEVIEQVRAAK